MMLRRALFWIRLLAYVFGLSGLALVMIGKRMEGAARAQWVGFGAGLMIAMFVLFLVSYLLYMIRFMRKG